MFDIHFYMKAHKINKDLLGNNKQGKEATLEKFEQIRRKGPVVYNIETTNACNMRCKMCPRTTMMNRGISTIKKETFENILSQLRPWTKEEWQEWEEFVVREYNIKKREMHENHFFLYIIPKVIQLHGYGDPLLDVNMHHYIRLLSENGFQSYFSCNPANINIEKTVQMFQNGLDYIKYSIESVDDEKHKAIRGNASNFTDSYKNIMELLEIKRKEKYTTTIIITMLDLNNTWQEDEYKKLKNAFKDKDVYIYLKSEDQQWYRKDFHGTNSIHWSEICKHPWMSMTVKSNAEVAMCMEDFNNEIILGNAEKNTLYDIWNGEEYKEFRMNHFNSKQGMKCTEECDMRVVGGCF